MDALSNVHWLVPPAVGAVAYKLSIKALQKVFPTTPKWINQFALVHNIILAVYSCVTFLAVGAQLLQYTDEVYTNKFFARVEFWSYLFYLSKYYEFIDTYILIMKQKPPSFLQTYHHTGAVLTMAAVYHTKASAIWVFVLFNSFIHTLMYTYYAMSILKIPAPFKRYLTMMQIVQFATGLMATAPYIYFTEEFSWESRVSVGVTQFYAFTLILLFVSFFKSTYSADKKKKEAAEAELSSNPATPSNASQAVKRTAATNTRSKAG